MATRALLYLGETSNKCIFTTVQYPNPRMQVQTSWRQARGFKRHRDTSKQAESAFSDVALGSGTLSPGRLWKPLGFTVAFGGASLVVATICEYERIRRHTHWVINQYHSATQRRRSGWRGEAEKLWRSLSDGERVFAPICFANVLVFLGWRVPALKNVMLKYFCANPSSSAMCWPMLLSTFSHYSVLHLAANMYVLHSFSTAAVACLGREQFVAYYLTSGVVSSFASHVYKTAFNMPGMSLGASGAIMGIVIFVCTQYPDTRLSIVMLPAWTFAASTAVKGILALDTLGCALRWRFLDHAAHLGGALYALFWQSWGNANIWQKREPIIKYWHDIRNPPRSSS